MATLLIVDDEEELRELLVFHMRRTGLTVVEASNGKEAMSVLAQNPVDAILSDVRMPVMNGIELLSAVRALPKPIPILLLSGYSDMSSAEAIAKGAEGLFTKPFDLPTLVVAIQKMLPAK